MEVFADFLMASKIRRAGCTEEVLVPKIVWNQPMFTDHGVHNRFQRRQEPLAVAEVAVDRFAENERGLRSRKKFVRFTWDRPFDYSLLKRMIEFNIQDKADCSTFWRKE